MEICESEGDIPKEFCTCDPITSDLVTQYLPELVAQYAPLTMAELTEDDIQYIREHLISGDLDGARHILSNWAYELHGNGITD